MDGSAEYDGPPVYAMGASVGPDGRGVYHGFFSGIASLSMLMSFHKEGKLSRRDLLFCLLRTNGYNPGGAVTRISFLRRANLDFSAEKGSWILFTTGSKVYVVEIMIGD